MIEQQVQQQQHQQQQHQQQNQDQQNEPNSNSQANTTINVISLPDSSNLIAETNNNNNEEEEEEATIAGLTQAKGNGSKSQGGQVTEIVAKLSATSAEFDKLVAGGNHLAATHKNKQQPNQQQQKQNLEISGQSHTVIECDLAKTTQDTAKEAAAAAANEDADSSQVNSIALNVSSGSSKNFPKINLANKPATEENKQNLIQSQQITTIVAISKPEAAIKEAGSEQLVKGSSSSSSSGGEINGDLEGNKKTSNNNINHQQQKPLNNSSSSSGSTRLGALTNSNSNIIPLTTAKYPNQADHIRPPYCKRRRLSYLQSLLLRRWPCLALTICIMTSLLFGILLSALTVYLMHGVTDCSGLALANSASRRSGSDIPHLGSFEPPRRDPFDSMAPLELASLTPESNGLKSRNYAPLSSGGSQSQAAATPDAATEPRTQFQRLPSTLWPQHYDLFVQPFIREPFNFIGKVMMILEIMFP